MALLGGSRTRAYARRLGVLGQPPGDWTLVTTTLLVMGLGLGLTIWIALLS